ncbi:MAG TPA: hypothetical protein DEB74_14255 [Lachnospiraceae bacterium]|nr:hypothetical protein [Lachnospiraceae bacterium]
MYIMRKLNREKKALTDVQRAALLAEGYQDITPVQQEDLSSIKEDSAVSKPVKKEKTPGRKITDKVHESVKKAKDVTETEEVKENIEKDIAVPKTQQSIEVVDSAQQLSEAAVFNEGSR